MRIRSLALLLMLVALVSAGHLSVAPTASAQAQLPTTAPAVADIPDQKLNATATALVAVNQIQQEYQEQLKRMAQDANKAAEKAVTDQGLSVDEFKTIVVAAQTDPDLRQKLLQRLPKSE